MPAAFIIFPPDPAALTSPMPSIGYRIVAPSQCFHLPHPQAVRAAAELIQGDADAGLAPAPMTVHLGAMSNDPILPAESRMHDLRARIDALDMRLVALLAERSRLIDEAAQIKLQELLPARIDSRVEEVAMNARRHAEAAGFDADLAEQLWRVMMEHFIAQEDRVLQDPASGGAAAGKGPQG